MNVQDFCTCIPQEYQTQIVIGCTLAGWVAGILMYRYGLIWKAKRGLAK